MNYKKGFTLIELLVVISIISLLSSIVLTSVSNARSRAKIVKVKEELRQINLALHMYQLENGHYPSEFQPGYNTQTQWNTPRCIGNYSNNSGSDIYSQNDRPNGQDIEYFDYYLSPYIDIVSDPWGNEYWVDAIYNCSIGEPEGCQMRSNGSWVWALGSGGPNKSGPNIYDSDNIIYMICDHEN